jgi:hypothetical protein
MVLGLFANLLIGDFTDKLLKEHFEDYRKAGQQSIAGQAGSRFGDRLQHGVQRKPAHMPQETPSSQRMSYLQGLRGCQTGPSLSLVIG